MKVLVVTNLLPTPAHPHSGTFVKQQIESLQQEGIQPSVLFVNRLEEGERAYVHFGNRVRQALLDSEAKLVHVMYGGIIAETVTRAVKDRPILVSYCGSDLLGEWLSGPIRLAISLYGVWCSRRAARRAAGIIVKSENLKRALPPAVPDDKVRIIPNGVDLKLFRPLDRRTCCSQLGWDHAAFHVLFPTNAGDPRKRKPLAFAAVRKLEQLGVPACFHELQNVPHHDVPIWLNACDVVLLTSFHEGSPNIVKEALACNTPVVSVDVGDVLERIAGVKGCYIADSSEQALAAKLYEVFRRKGTIDGRSHVTQLSLARVAERIRQFYEEVLSTWESERDAFKRRSRIFSASTEISV